ncbi:MAG: HupE/UreJ family protein [Burkholderiaceae bacterium]
MAGFAANPYSRPFTGFWVVSKSLLAALLLLIAAMSTAQAHLMNAQRGTLNLVNTGGYVVLSVPVAAFTHVDDNADGRLSMGELRTHAKEISTQVTRAVQLIGESGPIELQGLMLNLAPNDSTPTAPASHLVVMGRFPFATGIAAINAEQQALSPLSPKFRLRFSLFGQTADTQRQLILVRHAGRTQKIEMTPTRQITELMPGPWQVLRDNARLGAEHVLFGLDHLLFLLIVLATGWRWRAIALALTTFTVGHAISLTAVVVFGLSLPAVIVEPAIAATVVAMLVFERLSSRSRRLRAPGWRLGLIFGCALIHGLGFAGALVNLGLDPSARILGLVGFNLGIEAAQLLVALAAGIALSGFQGLQRGFGLCWPPGWRLWRG